MGGDAFAQAQPALVEDFLAVNGFHDGRYGLFLLSGRYVKTAVGSLGAVDDTVPHKLLQQLANGVLVLVDESRNLSDAAPFPGFKPGTQKDDGLDGRFTGKAQHDSPF